MLNLKPEAMEKIMIFSFALLFEIMTAIPPQPMHKHPKPAPVNGQNNIERVASNQPNAASDNTKPVIIYPKAELWHSPE
jgi:hypothetical protein